MPLDPVDEGAVDLHSRAAVGPCAHLGGGVGGVAHGAVGVERFAAVLAVEELAHGEGGVEFQILLHVEIEVQADVHREGIEGFLGGCFTGHAVLALIVLVVVQHRPREVKTLQLLRDLEFGESIVQLIDPGAGIFRGMGGGR